MIEGAIWIFLLTLSGLFSLTSGVFRIIGLFEGTSYQATQNDPDVYERVFGKFVWMWPHWLIVLLTIVLYGLHHGGYLPEIGLMIAVGTWLMIFSWWLGDVLAWIERQAPWVEPGETE